jgi:3'-phosphoadenosine 5'-phosphosulfate (PAPS) 3'-phosphatase
MGAHTETLESYLDAAVEAAKRAGQIILSNFYVTKAVEHKGKVDLVTETDKACETMIFQYLESAFPSHQVSNLCVLSMRFLLACNAHSPMSGILVLCE